MRGTGNKRGEQDAGLAVVGCEESQRCLKWKV